jgi:voltage-gated potassium channel
VTKEGEVVAHPQGDEHVHAQSLIVLVKTEFKPEEKAVTQAIEDYFQKQISAKRDADIKK